MSDNQYDFSGQSPSYSDNTTSYPSYSAGVDTSSASAGSATEQGTTSSNTTPVVPAPQPDIPAVDDSNASAGTANAATIIP